MTSRLVFAVVMCALMAAGAVVSAQGRGQGQGRGGPEKIGPFLDALNNGIAARGALPQGTDPLGGPVVQNAPYSASAVTSVTQVLSDGTRIEQMTRARFHRDSAGRIRRDQTIVGLGDTPQETITIDPDPGDVFAYTLDAETRTARRVTLNAGLTLTWNVAGGQVGVSINRQRERVVSPDWTAGVRAPDVTSGLRVQGGRGGPVTTPAGAQPKEESLGTQQIEGLKAIGRRTTTVIPTGQIGNDRPIEITDERWESPELGLLIRSRFHDPRTGTVEYQLTNIVRAEPPADLFQVPPDYTVVGGPADYFNAAPGGPGARGRGGRGVPPGTGR
jgi:hypothetical protein